MTAAFSKLWVRDLDGDGLAELSAWATRTSRVPGQNIHHMFDLDFQGNIINEREGDRDEVSVS